MRWLSLCVLLVACGDPGTGKQTVQVVENETPPSRLAPVETIDLVSGIDGEGTDVGTAEPPEVAPMPRPTDGIAPDALRTRTTPRAEKARYEDYVLKPLDDPGLGSKDANRKRRENLPRPTSPGRSQTKSRTNPSTTQAQAMVWPGGSSPIAAPADTVDPTTNLFPAGTLFRARLLGDVWVSQSTPLVLAVIEREDGSPIGTAIGRASLHPHLRDRVTIRLDQLVLEGRVVSSQFLALDLDRAEGLRGKASRQPLRQILMGSANALLGALSLEVGVGNGLAEVFRVQLADRLLEQARGNLDAIDLHRVVYLDRGRSFWVMVESRTNQSASVNPHVESLQSVFAERVAPRENARHKDLMNAYQKLNRSLENLGGLPRK